jgi:acetate kinase
MGLTPTGGVVMATRSGDIDPGLIIELMRHPPPGTDGDAAALEALLNHRSGLHGLSGTGDMRELLERRTRGDAEARLAVDVFCRAVSKQVGALAAAMAGIDTLVFTGGIGQSSAPIRAQVCERLGFLGIELAGEANQNDEPVISAAGRVTVRVLAADEERIIARHTAATAGLTSVR